MISEPTPTQSTIRHWLQREAPFGIAVACAALIYLILAAISATREPWNIDEMYTYWLSSMSPAEMISATIRDQHPPLFYLLLTVWLQLWPAMSGMKVFALLLGLSVVPLAA